MSLLNEKVASVSAKLALLNEIPAEELKKNIIAVIKRDGLTFGEQSFLNNVINCLLSKRRNRCHYLFVKNMEKEKNAKTKRR